MVNSFRASSLKEALRFQEEEKAIPFAGGTDLMVRRRGYTGTEPKFDEPILFLDAIPELRQIGMRNNMLCIGAAVTLSEILDFSSLPILLRCSIQSIASPGLRNMATLAGNICNASPAGDSIPPLYVHEAEFVLLSRAGGERIVASEEFFTGPGKTILKSDEILTEIRVPILEEGITYYRKVGTRRANALSKLSVAAYALKDDKHLREFRFSVGSVAPTVLRLHHAESLVKEGADDSRVLEAVDAVICPISDQRSTSVYRRQVVLNALQEFLHRLKGS